MEETLLTRFSERLRKEEGEIEEQIQAYNRIREASLKDSVHELSDRKSVV